MQPIVKFDRTLVTVLVDEVVHVMLELVAPPATPVDRAPLDVVVVLDRSGSMSGPPLQSVTAATAQLLRLAGPDDRIGVVAFDDEVQLVLPLAHHDPAVGGRAVRQIHQGGSTNLSGGWLKGLEMLTTAPRAEALRRIVVLTDGHANAGIVGADQLVPLIKSGHRQGVTTSCIGFDDGYDEQLLAALADGGMGNDYWCAGPDQAAQVFADEFGGLAAVVAQNVSVEITPTDAVAATAVLNEFPVTELANGLQVAMGDAYGSEHRKLVAKFHLRPTAVQGTLDVATLTIRWAAVAGDVALHTVTVPLKVSVGDVDSLDAGADDEVTEEVTRLEVARHRREAREAADRGDYGTASALLSTSADMLSAFPSEALAAAELRRDALNLGEGQWTASDAKRQYARSRSTSKGRRTEYFEPESGPDEGPDQGPSAPPRPRAR
jgi:Ca-activated chloride channel family protein